MKYLHPPVLKIENEVGRIKKKTKYLYFESCRIIYMEQL